MSAFREWRLRRAELALADHEYHVRNWGWAFKPSDDARAEAKSDRLKRRVARLAVLPAKSKEME